MKFTKPPSWLLQLFESLLPDAGGTRRQMFGYPCGFEKGQMFTGLFQDSLFVRLGEEDRAALLAREGAKVFDPMGGRPMREYVVLPPSLLEDEEELLRWMKKAREYAGQLLPKPAKKRGARK